MHVPVREGEHKRMLAAPALDLSDADRLAAFWADVWSICAEVRLCLMLRDFDCEFMPAAEAIVDDLHRRTSLAGSDLDTSRDWARAVVRAVN